MTIGLAVLTLIAGVLLVHLIGCEIRRYRLKHRLASQRLFDAQGRRRLP